METLIVIVIIAIAAAWLIWRALRRKPAPAVAPNCPSGSCEGCHCASRPKDKGALVLALLIALAPSHANAADTVETWARGATDVDFYLGAEGLGAGQKSFFADVMVGYGLLDRLGIFIGSALRGSDTLEDGEAEVYGGLFATLLDTRHVDFDLMFEVRGGGPAMSRLQLRPGFELNLDADPQMASWGFYLRGGLPLYDRDLLSSGHPQHGHDLSGVHLELTVGAYYRLGANHQLLLEHDLELRPQAGADDPRVGVGGIALGYNLQLDDTLELVSQLYVDLPQAGEQLAFGLTFGFILTVPRA